MKFAIITSKVFESSRTRAESLNRMFGKIGVRSKIFYHLGTLSRLTKAQFSKNPRGVLKRIYDFKGLIELARYDVLIICGYMQPAFLKGYWEIETLRNHFPHKPIVLFLVSYLGNSPDWQKRIYEKKGYGISRYDWHLVVSPVGKKFLTEDHPCQAIGLNLEIPQLQPNQKKEFLALLDYKREGFEPYREIQIKALEDLKIPFIELTQSHTFSQIYSIYKQTSIYFLAFLESFGIPICETQLCGNFVFTPDRTWPQAHRLHEYFIKKGNIVLTKNFYVYNGLNELKKRIQDSLAKHNPEQIYKNFVENYPNFYYGNTDELKRFVDRAEDRALWGRGFQNQ